MCSAKSKQINSKTHLASVNMLFLGFAKIVKIRCFQMIDRDKVYEEIQDLMFELEGIQCLLEDNDDFIDELICQVGTIDTILKGCKDE